MVSDMEVERSKFKEVSAKLRREETEVSKLRQELKLLEAQVRIVSISLHVETMHKSHNRERFAHTVCV